jgi:MinD-like ATPase involved in chromosome partitioning or flagellar assembly
MFSLSSLPRHADFRYPPRRSQSNICEVEKTLKRTVNISIPNEGRLVTDSVNTGVPFALSNPNAKISLAVKDLARAVDPQSKGERAERGGAGRENASPRRRIASVFAGIFGFFIHG